LLFCTAIYSVVNYIKLHINGKSYECLENKVYFWMRMFTYLQVIYD
jgi:hypothetical protein